MLNNLKLNPYAEIAFENEGTGDCLLAAPKAGAGPQVLRISEAEYPDLYLFLQSLLQMGLGGLDVENDLDDSERALFAQHSILIPSAQNLEKPLFSCLLDDIETSGVNTDGELIVNPAFRLEPFDLSNFRALATEKNLSPYSPIVWVKSAGVELDTGYWITMEQAELMSQFRAGEKIPAAVDSEFLKKLAAAEIAIEPSRYRQTQEESEKRIAAARDRFAQFKYAVVENVFPEFQLRAVQQFYRSYIEQGFMPFGDSQVSGRFRQPDEPLARSFHHSLTSLMSKLAGEEVKPSYCYAASYRGGAVLKPHIDRAMCEYSFSIQIDYEPAPANGISPWPLYVSTRELDDDTKFSLDWDEFSPDQETEKSIALRNGDCLAYKGCELAHYRYPLPDGHRSTSLFFHYVPIGYTDDLI